MPNSQINQDDINKAVWAACDTFRGVISADTYKDFILTMLFLKYISDVRQDKVEELTKQFGDNKEMVEAMLASQSFKIPAILRFVGSLQFPPKLTLVLSLYNHTQ